MKRIVAVLFAIGLSVSATACSSSPPNASLPPGAVPGGSADIVINDSDATHSHTVDCTRIGSTTLITVSENDTSLRISVNNRHELDVEYVDMNDVDGFTGSYLEDLQGKAGVLLTDQTYRLSGTAEGFYAAHPAARTTARFDIRFAC